MLLGVSLCRCLCVCMHETCVIIVASHASLLVTLAKLRRDLEGLLKPDHSLLSELRRRKVLTRPQMDHILNERKDYRRNEIVLNLLMSEEQCDGFMKTLKETGQQDVINFITQNRGQVLS